MQIKASKEKGFTLVEILIVILIIGIALAGIVPQLTPRDNSQDKLLKAFDDAINFSLAEAKSRRVPVAFPISILDKAITFTYNSSIEPESFPFPDNLFVASLRIGQEIPFGNTAYVFVYPDGYMDYLQVKLSDGSIVETMPLTLKARYSDDYDDF